MANQLVTAQWVTQEAMRILQNNLKVSGGGWYPFPEPVHPLVAAIREIRASTPSCLEKPLRYLDYLPPPETCQVGETVHIRKPPRYRKP